MTTEETTIKCVRCANQLVLGEVAASPQCSREDAIKAVVGQLGWKNSFAGWQCPKHGG